AALRPPRVLGDPLQPRVAAPADALPPEQGRSRRRRDQPRPHRRAVARRPRRRARLGVRGRRRPGPVDDAPARAGRGLRRRQRSPPQRGRAGRARLRPRGPRLAGVRAHRRVAPPRPGRAPRPGRRRLVRAARARLGAARGVRGPGPHARLGAGRAAVGGARGVYESVTRRRYNPPVAERELEIPAQEGISADADAVYETLRRELDRETRDLASVRGLAERFWPVTAEKPLERRAGLKGWAAFQVKRVLRKLMRWYVEPALAEQRIV